VGGAEMIFGVFVRDSAGGFVCSTPRGDVSHEKIKNEKSYSILKYGKRRNLNVLGLGAKKRKFQHTCLIGGSSCKLSGE
jgi:hypothetical protein